MNDEIRKQMDEKYLNGKPYCSSLLWDIKRGREIDKIAVNVFCRPANGKIVLDLGSGDGCGSMFSIGVCDKIILTDISEVAMNKARERYRHSFLNARFIQADACNLDFVDGSFDIVIAKEVVEHVEDPTKLISEAFRVLKPGGIFSLTSPNKNSLHLIMSRKLGYGDFKCSNDHIKEYTYDEIKEMIISTGFYIDCTKGIYLMPYWGVSGLDGARRLTDNDEEINNLFLELGRLVGPRYAFCYAIKAIKPE